MPNKCTGASRCSMGTGIFQAPYVRTTNWIIERPPSPRTTKRNRSNKTYSARLTRWLDRLAHFDTKKKHIARKHLGLTDFLSRNPVSKSEPKENYDEEYAINCMIPLLEFINTHRSINESKMKETRADHSKKCKQKINQSQNCYQNKPKPRDGKAKNRSSLLSTQQKVSHVKIHEHKKIRLDYKKIEQLDKEDITAETLVHLNYLKTSPNVKTNVISAKHCTCTHSRITRGIMIKW